jgi:protein TonB
MDTFKMIFLVSTLLLTFNSYSQNDNEKEIEFGTIIFDFEPEFPGGSDSLKNFLLSNTKYPDTCISLNSKGKVLMQFCIEPDGSITNIKAYKNNTGCDQFSMECIRVISKMPKWLPPEEDGLKKRSIVRLPFNFKND